MDGASNPVSIRRAKPADWQRVRAIRLRALSDAPDAFGTTLAEDEARPMSTWRERLENDDAATFLASTELDDEDTALLTASRATHAASSPHEGTAEVPQLVDLGLVVGAPFDGREGAAGLFAMWVAPEARGSGIADRLVQAVIDWASERGYERLLLDVADDNKAAIKLYERMGFEPTGNTGTLPPPRTHVREHERAFSLRDALED